MVDQVRLSRGKPRLPGRGAKQARARNPGSKDPAAAEFHVFGELQQREFDRSPWPMRIFEHGTFRFLAVNDAAVKLYGYSREEFLKLTARDTRHRDEHAEFLTTLIEPTEYLRHRGARRHIRKNGEIIVVEAVTQDILFNGRKARLSMNIDVTERNKAEVELRRQKHLLETVINNIPARIFIRDAKTSRYVMRNRVSEEISGHPIGSSIGKSVYDLFPREFADLFSRTDAEALKTGRLVEIPELRVTGKSGEPRILHVRKVPVFDDNGQPWVLVGISEDITERKRTEDALRESNEFLRSVIESSGDCIKVLDLEGRLKLMNDGGRRLLEIDDLAPLLNTEWLEFWRGADQAAAGAALDAARRGGVGSFEGYCPTQKGSPRWWDVVVTPILDAGGKPARLLAVSRDITAHKQAEFAAHRSAELARLLESLARAANEALTPEAAMVACLERICRHGRWLLGRVELFERGRPGETAGRSIWYALERERFAEFIRISNGHVHNLSGPFIGRVLRERTAVWIEDWRQKAGYRRWQAAVSHDLRSAFAFPVIARGEVVAVIEVFSDDTRPPDPHIMGATQLLAAQLARIVERESAYQANTRMATIVESSQDAIMSRAVDGTILTWNPAAERLFGYTAAEIVGRKIEILYPPEIKADLMRRQELLLEGQPVQAFESVRLTKDGRRVHVLTSPAPIRDSSGKICGVSTIVRDITRRMLAEQELRQAQQRLQVAVQGGNVGLWDWDMQSGAVYFSPEWKRQLGYEDHEVPSRYEEWESRVHPEDLPRVSAEVRKFLEKPGSDYQREYRMRHEDGSYRWILSRASVQVGADGRAQRMFGCHVDITTQKQAEAERLDNAMRQRDALVNEVHHRIKNSLQGVVGLLRQKIRKNPVMTADIEETISQLQSVALVYGLQETRPDGMITLAEIVEEVCASTEGIAGGQVKRTLERKSPRPACVAGTEAVSIAVALNELVFNALKHQPARAGRKRARVTLRETENGAEVRMSNRGRLPQGFDYAAGRALGHGLGLVRTLLASPGGDVAFRNGRGKVEVVLTLAPPLLAERQKWLTRRMDDGRAGKEKAAAARTGRGRRPVGAGGAG